VMRARRKGACTTAAAAGAGTASASIQGMTPAAVKVVMQLPTTILCPDFPWALRALMCVCPLTCVHRASSL
jgi:hypothetical protein